MFYDEIQEVFFWVGEVCSLFILAFSGSHALTDRSIMDIWLKGLKVLSGGCEHTGLRCAPAGAEYAPAGVGCGLPGLQRR